MGIYIENSNFTSDADPSKSFKLPYLGMSEVELTDDKTNFVLTSDSQKMVSESYELTAKSSLNKGGSVIVFGTYDNLHIGHMCMLKTAKALGNDLYVGLESYENAIARKASKKHPIQPDKERLKNIREINLTDKEKVFIRKDALSDIQRLIESGVPLKTLLIGCTQNDNPEMVKAVEWCINNNIQVVAMDRFKVKGGERVISSSALHKARAKARIENILSQKTISPLEFSKVK